MASDSKKIVRYPHHDWRDNRFKNRVQVYVFNSVLPAATDRLGTTYDRWYSRRDTVAQLLNFHGALIRIQSKDLRLFAAIFLSQAGGFVTRRWRTGQDTRMSWDRSQSLRGVNSESLFLTTHTHTHTRQWFSSPPPPHLHFHWLSFMYLQAERGKSSSPPPPLSLFCNLTRSLPLDWNSSARKASYPSVTSCR